MVTIIYNIIYLTIIISGLCLVGVILSLLVNKKLNESNAVLWLYIGVVIILAGLFPKAVVKLSDIFYITYPPALIFTAAIIILLFIVLKNTIDISLLSARMQETATETSILKHEIDELKKELDQLRQNKKND